MEKLRKFYRCKKSFDYPDGDGWWNTRRRLVSTWDIAEVVEIFTFYGKQCVRLVVHSDYYKDRHLSMAMDFFLNHFEEMQDGTEPQAVERP